MFATLRPHCPRVGKATARSGGEVWSFTHNQIQLGAGSEPVNGDEHHLTGRAELRDYSPQNVQCWAPCHVDPEAKMHCVKLFSA